MILSWSNFNLIWFGKGQEIHVTIGQIHVTAWTRRYWTITMTPSSCSHHFLFFRHCFLISTTGFLLVSLPESDESDSCSEFSFNPNKSLQCIVWARHLCSSFSEVFASLASDGMRVSFSSPSGLGNSHFSMKTKNNHWSSQISRIHNLLQLLLNKVAKLASKGCLCGICSWNRWNFQW